ncbi:hypothetical protein ACH0CA_07845 [Kytococcus sedentarius]|uniref:hypothetical protein n=1 Tax=Kytococcus sedentarius TaxID=1276 RepID=UPI003879EE53
MDEFRDLAKVTAPLNPVTGPVFVEGRRVVRPPHPAGRRPRPPVDLRAVMSRGESSFVAIEAARRATGSSDPDLVHPFRAVGAVTVARIEKRWLRG